MPDGLAAVPDPEDPDASLPGEDEAENGIIHDEVVIEGDGQLTLTVGGKRPNVSKVVIRGGAIPFQGEAKKGDHVAVELQCRVGEIHVIDKVDSKTREVVETIRKHVLRVEGARLVDDDGS